MEQQIVWSVLGLEPTKDENTLKNRYHELLREVNPEDDPEGFKRLREAYETAMELARKPEELSEGDEKPKDEIDLWLDKVNDIYWYVDTRTNPEMWEKLFDDPICIALDTALEVRERFLVFLMSHVYIDQRIWKLIDKEFNIIADKQELSEMFPKDFLDYVQYQVENQNFLTYELLEVKGLDEAEISLDTYISNYLKIKAEIDRQEFGNQWQELEDLKAFEVYHPYEDVERIRLYIHEEKQEEAVSAGQQLLEEYPDDVYIGYWVGQAYWTAQQWESAYQCWQHVMECLPDHYTARVGIAGYYMKVGKNTEAKDLIMELLEINGRDDSVLEMMREVNIPLIDYYHELAKQEPEEKKHGVEACWCMFQNEMFPETIKELDQLDLQPEDPLYYDYVNMKGRCYLGLEQYEPAIEYLLKWDECRQKLVDDGSDKYKKRQAREGFIKCAIGIAYQNLKNYKMAEEYLKEGIPLEHDNGARFSFMDRLALLYYDMEKYEMCIDVCSRIVEEEPGYYPAYLRRQQAYFELQNGQGVVDDYYNAIHIFPKFYKPYLLAVKVFCIYRQYEDAKKTLEAAKEQGVEQELLDFYEVRVLRNLAQSEEDNKKVMALCQQLKKKLKEEEKKEELEKDESTMSEAELVEQDMRKDGMPKDKVDMRELAFEEILICMDMNQVDYAMQLTLKEIKSGNTNYRLHWVKADIHRIKKEYEEALKEYDYLLNLMPDNADFLFYRGICLERIGNKEEAIQAFRKTLEKDPEHNRVNHELMKIYSQRFDRYELRTAYGAALKAINAQLKLVPDAYYYIERGLLYMDNYNMELALADYRKALELEPDNLYAYNNIGFVLRVQRKYEEAISHFKKAIEKMTDEKSLLPYTNMAKCYEAMGQPEQGIEILLEALKHFKPNTSLYRSLIELYSFAGSYEKAKEICEEGLEKKLFSQYDYYKEMSNIHILEGDAHATIDVYKRWIAQTKGLKENNRYVWEKRHEALTEYGGYLFYRRDLKQAIKVLEEAFRMAQKFKFNGERCGLKLGMAYRLTGDLKKAKAIAVFTRKMMLHSREIPEHLKELEQEDPETEAVYISHRPLAAIRMDDLAQIYICMGDAERAIQYLDQVDRIPPCRHCAFPVCYDILITKLYLAECRGERNKALQLCRQAYAINPTDPEVVMTLRRLEGRIK